MGWKESEKAASFAKTSKCVLPRFEIEIHLLVGQGSHKCGRNHADLMVGEAQARLGTSRL